MKPQLVIHTRNLEEPADGPGGIVNMAIAVRFGVETCPCPKCVGQIIGEILLAAHRERDYLSNVDSGAPPQPFPMFAEMSMSAAQRYTEVAIAAMSEGRAGEDEDSSEQPKQSKQSKDEHFDN